MKRWSRYFPAGCLMILIFALSAMSGTTVNAVGLSKESYHINGHFILFFLLTVSYFKATKKIVWSQVLAFIYAVSDEIHQLYVPGRSFQYLDLFVDLVGILIAGVFIWWSPQILPKKLKNWLNN